jgi:anthraniloyl-CoA monooxygenase
MNVLVVGGGPAGLYFSLLAKKADPSHEIRVVERNPPGATYGWGVVFSDRTLESFREADYRTYLAITEEFVIWDAIDIRFKGRVIRCGGQVFSGISRKQLLSILYERCAEVGVEVVFEQEVDPGERFDNADLIVGADGVRSVVRETHHSSLRPRLVTGSSRYIWFGTHLPFDSFTFIFRTNEHGLFQVHAYPFDGSTSTFIVECSDDAWRRAGLDRADEQTSLDYCERLFADDLHGHALLSNKSQWLNFATIKNRSWRTGNVVLVGDAAHTAHFSIGSGTKLAMEDAIALADALQRTTDVSRALDEYEAERKPVVERFQEAAAQSQSYFEHTERYLDFEPEQFAFHLLSRSGRMDYPNIRLRDPYFVAAVDQHIASRADGRPAKGKFESQFRTRRDGLPTPPLARKNPESALGGAVPYRVAMHVPPALTPVGIGELRLANRAVALQPPVYSARDGHPGDEHRSALMRAASSGVALVITQRSAVSAEGRVTVGCPGLYSPEHTGAWKGIVSSLRQTSNAKIAVCLGHAGARAATLPRSEGADVPLPEPWATLAASAYAYVKGGPVARPMDRSDIDRVREEFVVAAGRALDAGFDMLQIDMAHGYLLAGFVSPLTNQRDDDYGGELENRMRFPVEVLGAVRAVTPCPVAVSISAADDSRRGSSPGSAVAIARALKDAGCDLIVVSSGQTTAASKPSYDPYASTSYSDQIRNEARVATVACGNVQTMDQVSTIIAGGRADLCRVILD